MLQPSLHGRGPLERFGLVENGFEQTDQQLIRGAIGWPVPFGIPRPISPMSENSLVDSARDWVQSVMSRRHARSSALDLRPLDLGEVLHPLNAEDDLLGEMLDDTRF